MATLAISREALRPAESAAEVFCPECSYELQPWEVHLLKHLGCPFCGAELALDASLQVELAVAPWR